MTLYHTQKTKQKLLSYVNFFVFYFYILNPQQVRDKTVDGQIVIQSFKSCDVRQFCCVKFNIGINDPSSESSTTMKQIEWNIIKIRTFENALLVAKNAVYYKFILQQKKIDQERVESLKNSLFIIETSL